ncbi:MAG TPA: 4-hydroxy-tetrahydrodipicolinate reductase [Candidatus Krumholzibacteria bacterium]|nr:4-hydroxy-tetrahydrodipicolinate reductase [Candidatus Krumholzibacteria bacterium]
MKAALLVNGAAGRMGRLVAAHLRRAGFADVAGCDTAAQGSLALEDGPLPLVESLVAGLEPRGVVVDFSHPGATPALVEAARACGARLVVGTTGQSEAEMELLREAATSVPVVLARNFSLGVQRIAQALAKFRIMTREGFDVELIEAHHAGKRDAPSGTAFYLLESLLGQEPPAGIVHGRFGPEARRGHGEVGVHSVRAGGLPGEHTLLLASADEVVEIRHRALSRAAFVSGVPPAVRFVQHHPPGLYSLLDVMGDAP